MCYPRGYGFEDMFVMRDVPEGVLCESHNQMLLSNLVLVSRFVVVKLRKWIHLL